jgi:hypothetical protein
VPDLPFFGLPRGLIAWYIKTLDMNSLVLAKTGISAAQEGITAANLEFAWKDMGASSVFGARPSVLRACQG